MAKSGEWTLFREHMDRLESPILRLICFIAIWPDSIGQNINKLVSLLEGSNGRLKIGGKYSKDFNYGSFQTSSSALDFINFNKELIKYYEQNKIHLSEILGSILEDKEKCFNEMNSPDFFKLIFNLQREILAQEPNEISLFIDLNLEKGK